MLCVLSGISAAIATQHNHVTLQFDGRDKVYGNIQNTLIHFHFLKLECKAISNFSVIKLQCAAVVQFHRILNIINH